MPPRNSNTDTGTAGAARRDADYLNLFRRRRPAEPPRTRPERGRAAGRGGPVREPAAGTAGTGVRQTLRCPVAHHRVGPGRRVLRPGFAPHEIGQFRDAVPLDPGVQEPGAGTRSKPALLRAADSRRHFGQLRAHRRGGEIVLHERIAGASHRVFAHELLLLLLYGVSCWWAGVFPSCAPSSATPSPCTAPSIG